MKSKLLWIALSAAAVCLIAPLASAQGLYNDGPINGETDAWTINFGFVVSDSFTISTGSSTINGFSFGAWLFPGDTLQSVDVLISSQEFSGTIFFNQQVNFMQSGCFVNSYGFDVCTETGSFTGPTLGNGTYWVNLLNAVTNTGDPVYWDENSGVGCTSPGCPSEAGPGGEGTLPSEAFTVLGSPTGTGSVPEPDSLLLLTGGLITAVGILRRRLL